MQTLPYLDPRPTTLQASIAAYLDDLVALRHPRTTTRSYRYSLKSFSAHLPGVLVADITNGHVRSWLASMSSRAAGTVNTRLVAVRCWGRWAAGEGDETQVQWDRIRGPKLPGPRLRHLTEAMVSSVLKVTGNRPRDVRDRAILELFYATGLRAAELVALDLGDLSMGDAATVHVRHGKGDKARTVPVGGAAVDALQAWLAIRGDLAREGEQALFLAIVHGHHPSRGRRLLYSGVNSLVHLHERGSRVTPHMFRHSFASHVLKGGCDVVTVAEMLGHKGLDTVRTYLHLDADHVRSAYNAAHPRARTA